MTRDELEKYENQSGYVRFKFDNRFIDIKTKYIREKRWDIIIMACDTLGCDFNDVRLQKSVDPTEKTIWPKETVDWSVPATAERSEA
jgi:hypothetical protein